MTDPPAPRRIRRSRVHAAATDSWGRRAGDARGLARPSGLLGAALVLAAINLRPGLASVGPVLPSIRRDLGLSGAQAGLLTTIPTLCFGLCAPVAPRLSRRFGIERTMVGALGVIGAMTALRVAGHAVAVLFVTTTALGGAIAIVQTLLPAVVKQRFPQRAVLATGVYALSINLGALLAASLAAPLAGALHGSWERSLASWSLLSPGAVVLWLVVRRATGPPAAMPAPSRMPVRDPAAWALTAYMGGLSIIYIVTLTWLAPLYRTHGYSSARSGVILSLFTGAQIVTGVLVPPLAQRRGDRRLWLSGAVAAVGIGSLGAAVAPLLAPAGWSIVGGLGMGAAFPLVLSLFVDRARHPEEAGGLSAMGFGGGYLIAAAGPALAGAVSDLTGSLAVPFAFIGAVAIAMVAATPALVGCPRPQPAEAR